jgi:hypothetical protein
VSNWKKIVFILALLFLFGSGRPVLADDCGYIQMNPNGKGLVCGKTGQLFVPLGWKATFPWWWKDSDEPRPNIDNWSYERWVRDELVANGVNFINIWLNINHQGSGISFEHNTGEYDPNNTQNITELFEACEKYGVKIKVSIFNNIEFKKWWEVNPYNANRPTDLWWCDRSPNGCIEGDALNKEEALTTFFNLQKNRFKFIYDQWGDSPAIAMWEPMVEVNGQVGGLGTGGVEKWIRDMAVYIEQVDTHNRPIIIGQIKRKWRAWGSIELPALPEEKPDDPTSNFEINKIYDMPEVDIPSVHNYQYFNLWDRFVFHRLVEQRYPTKSIHFGGGSGVQRACDIDNPSAPCVEDGYGYGLPPKKVNGPFIPEFCHEYHDRGHYDRYESPWITTLAHVWVNLIASGGTGTTTRCPCAHGIYTINGFSSLYKGPSKFVQAVDWSRWDTSKMKPWEDWQWEKEDWEWEKREEKKTWESVRGVKMDPWKIKKPVDGNDNPARNADFLAATGDGDQLMMIVRGSQNNVKLTIKKTPELESGTYTVKIFDWLTGDVVEDVVDTETVSISSQPDTTVNLVLDLSDDRLPPESNNKCHPRSGDCRMVIIYMEKTSSSPPAPPPSCSILQLFPNWFTLTCDQNGDGKVNSLDFGLILAR